MTLCPTADNFSWVPSTGAGGLRAEGSWFRDAIELTDLAIANFSMGIAYDFSTDSGVLGLGFPNPSTKSLGDGLIWALVEQGVATTEAFSVWLAGWSNHIGLFCMPSFVTLVLTADKTPEAFCLEPSTQINTLAT